MIRLLWQLLKRRLAVRRQLPFRVGLALTYRCNSQCLNCHIWENPSLKNEELSEEEITNILNELKSDLIFLEFLGGEPFLRDDIAEIIKNSGKLLPKSVFIGVTSNGLRTEFILNAVSKVMIGLKQPLTIGISIDGSEAINDFLRGQKGSFKKAMNTFLGLKQLTKKYSNLLPHISYTIFPENAGQLKQFINMMKSEYKILEHEISISYAQKAFLYHNKTEKNPNRKLSENDLKVLIKLINQTSSSLLDRLKESFKSFFLGNLPEYLLEKRWSTKYCAAGRDSAYIAPDGSVFPCISWNKLLGKLRGGDFRGVWFGQKAKEVEKELQQGRCPSCWTVCEAQPTYIRNWPFLKRLSSKIKS